MTRDFSSTSERYRLTLGFVVLMVQITTVSAIAGPVVDFDDVDFWVGTGANRAALALDWQGNITTDNALVWGYRFDGTPKTVDMILAIVAADPRLFAKIGPVGGFGTAVIGLGYDANHDGEFAIDDDTAFDEQGFANSGPADGALSVDPGDWYVEGWFVSGFWQYGVATGNPYDGGSWARSGSGVSGRNLLNDSWHSLAFTPTFSNQAFARNPLSAEPSGNADFDGDGDVDGRDFLAWQRGFGITTGALPANGDANGDGAVDAADLGFWSDQFGATTMPLNAITIPEPSTAQLISFVVLLSRLIHPRRRFVS